MIINRHHHHVVTTTTTTHPLTFAHQSLPQHQAVNITISLITITNTVIINIITATTALAHPPRTQSSIHTLVLPKCGSGSSMVTEY
eukprot:5244605-Pyramimonas_sp.AAC.1